MGKETLNRFAETQRPSLRNRAPRVKTEVIKVRPRWLKALLGLERIYFVHARESLKDYRVCIGASHYGNILRVTWYLTCELGLFRKTVRSFLAKVASEKALSFILNIFRWQDLTAYAAVIRGCLPKSFERLTSGLDRDSLKIDRTLGGFSGIS